MKQRHLQHDIGLVKKILYEFKKFARGHNFWEQYKRDSTPINEWNLTFIDVVDTNEPIKLIQSADSFCCWRNSYPKECSIPWHELSCMWAEICLEKHLYYNGTEALHYARTWISNIIFSDKKFEELIKE
jgi:hypothetical protein